MDKKVKTLDRALRALFPKTYKGLRNHIIEEYEYDMAVKDGYEVYDDHYYWSLLKEEEQELDIDEDEDYWEELKRQEEWEKQAIQEMQDAQADMHNEELARLEDERIRQEAEREAERRTNNVRQLCIEDPSLADIYREYLNNYFYVEEAEEAVEQEVERRKAERTKFLDDVIGKISTEGLDAAMDFYRNNKTSP